MTRPDLLVLLLGLVLAAGGCQSVRDRGPDEAAAGIRNVRVTTGTGVSAGGDMGAMTTRWQSGDPLGFNPYAPGRVVQAAGTEGPSRVERISSSFKSGWEKFTAAVTPQTPVSEADDPIKLSTPGKPGPELYVALARISERAGNSADAEAKYRQALELDPKHVPALVGYAHVKDRRGLLAEATELYQKAAQLAPKDPTVANELGLCLARRGMYRESVAALERAVRLRPTAPLLRNNIAHVLVQMGDYHGALTHLMAVHKQAVAHYNLGVLAHKKGDPDVAKQSFVAALRLEPGMTQAKTWLDYLSTQPAAGPKTPQVAAGQQQPVPPRQTAAPSPAQAAPRYGAQTPHPGQLQQRPAPQAPGPAGPRAPMPPAGPTLRLGPEGPPPGPAASSGDAVDVRLRTTRRPSAPLPPQIQRLPPAGAIR